MKKFVIPVAIAASAAVVIFLSRSSSVGTKVAADTATNAVADSVVSGVVNVATVVPPTPSATPAPPRTIDLDLVRMSKTMRDAWSVKIVEQPEDLVGKIVRIRGDFCAYDDGDGQEIRYVCALKDPAGCCTLGEVEFRLRGQYEWPKDFPEDFTPVTVSGRIEIARNGDGEARPRLADADMEWMSR